MLVELVLADGRWVAKIFAYPLPRNWRSQLMRKAQREYGYAVDFQGSKFVKAPEGS